MVTSSPNPLDDLGQLKAFLAHPSVGIADTGDDWRWVDIPDPVLETYNDPESVLAAVNNLRDGWLILTDRACCLVNGNWFDLTRHGLVEVRSPSGDTDRPLSGAFSIDDASSIALRHVSGATWQISRHTEGGGPRRLRRELHFETIMSSAPRYRTYAYYDVDAELGYYRLRFDRFAGYVGEAEVA